MLQYLSDIKVEQLEGNEGGEGEEEEEEEVEEDVSRSVSWVGPRVSYRWDVGGAPRRTEDKGSLCMTVKCGLAGERRWLYRVGSTANLPWLDLAKG